MRYSGANWGPPGAGRGPSRHIGFRLFGFLFFLLFFAAVVGGLVALASSSRPFLFLFIGLFLLFLLMIFFARIARRSWAPVAQLIDATSRLGEGDTSVRMKLRGRGPWLAVAGSFNKMADRLEAEDERRRRLLADLGHEMRTPLAVIRGEIEAVIDGVHQPGDLENVIDEVQIMERLLEDLRTLAVAEAGRLELSLEPTDLEELANDVVSSFTSRMSSLGVAATITREPGTGDEDVDPHRMHQVLSNLVGNAITQMPDGGELEITVGPGWLTVADTGPGIDAEYLESIFDRFEKAADSTGSGLGLSIARDLVEAHGGSLTAANGAGGGAIFTIRFADEPPGP